jgi:hypothetical protein
MYYNMYYNMYQYMYVILHTQLANQHVQEHSFSYFSCVLTCHRGTGQLIKRATVSVALAAVVKPREALLTNC